MNPINNNYWTSTPKYTPFDLSFLGIPSMAGWDPPKKLTTLPSISITLSYKVGDHSNHKLRFKYSLIRVNLKILVVTLTTLEPPVP